MEEKPKPTCPNYYEQFGCDGLNGPCPKAKQRGRIDTYFCFLNEESPFPLTIGVNIKNQDSDLTSNSHNNNSNSISRFIKGSQ